MLCILCTSISEQMLDIFDENGINLNISKIIMKHFWLQPNPEVPNAKLICTSCWSTLNAFHAFYESIEEAHIKLTSCIKTPEIEKDLESNQFDSFSELFTAVVKEESYDENSKPETVECLASTLDDKEDDDDVSDNESSKTNRRRRTSVQNEKYKQSDSNDSFSSNNTDDDQHQEEDIDSDSDYNAPKKKAKVKVKSPSTVINKWGQQKIPCKEFDAFIKKNIKLKCSLCAKSVDNFHCLKEHFLKVHKTDPYVVCCDKQWTSRFSLVQHLLLHQDPDLLKCKKCGRVLANMRSFNNHMQSHVTQERVHECTKCKKMFSSIPKLEKHLKTHTRKTIDQVCEQCGKVCHSKQSLSAHQKREHLGYVKQRVQCTVCGVYLSEASVLHFHMKYQHPKEKVVYSCHICGKVSASGYGLKRHIQYMHTMERVHKCAICDDKAFKTAQMLRPNAELDNAKFICSLCWKTIESFHNFYKSIEDAHAVLANLLKLPDKESDNEVDAFSELLSTVKQENSDETESESPEIPKVILTDDGSTELAKEHADVKNDSKEELNLDTASECLPKTRKSLRKADKSSDSESDFSQGSDHDQDENEDHQQDTDSDSDSDYDTSKRKDVKSKKYSEKSYEPGAGGLHRKDFDSYIKKTMPLVCHICTEPLDNFVVLKEHYKKAHKTDGYVTCCDRQWTSRFSLVHHLLHHQNPDLFKCPKCARVLSTKRSFNNHMKTHVVQKPVHKCMQCNKSFATKFRLEKHLRTHEKNRDDADQICDQCGKIYHSKQVLRIHQKRDHLGLMKPKQRVQCPECGVYLGDDATLKFHTKHLHPKTKVVHSCEICGKISATAYGTKRHMKYMHTMERVHKCTICEDKAFKTAQRLRVRGFIFILILR